MADRENYDGSIAAKVGCAVLIAAIWAANLFAGEKKREWMAIAVSTAVVAAYLYFVDYLHPDLTALPK